MQTSKNHERTLKYFDSKILLLTLKYFTGRNVRYSRTACVRWLGVVQIITPWNTRREHIPIRRQSYFKTMQQVILRQCNHFPSRTLVSPEFFSSSFHWGRCHYFSSLRTPQGCLDVLAEHIFRDLCAVYMGLQLIPCLYYPFTTL